MWNAPAASASATLSRGTFSPTATAPAGATHVRAQANGNRWSFTLSGLPALYSGTVGGTVYTNAEITYTVTETVPDGYAIKGDSSIEYSVNAGGTASHDFTHTTNTTVSASTASVTVAANTRGTAKLTVSADLSLTIVCNNLSDNYIWIRNSGSAEVDIVIGSVQNNGSAVSNVYVPSDGITVPAGGLCEIGVICNADGAFITSRNDLTL